MRPGPSGDWARKRLLASLASFAAGSASLRRGTSDWSPTLRETNSSLLRSKALVNVRIFTCVATRIRTSSSRNGLARKLWNPDFKSPAFSCSSPDAVIATSLNQREISTAT